MLGLIQASALLHQFQRKWDADGRIIASPDDYKLVKKRFGDVLARSMGSAGSQRIATFLEDLRRAVDGRGRFTIADLTGKVDGCTNKIRGCVNELVSLGQVQVLQASVGNKPTVYGFAPDGQPLNTLDLPDVKEPPVREG